MEKPYSDRLKQAISALREGDRVQARALILAELKDNPKYLSAWLWALEVAVTDQEKRSILGRILKLDPTHQGALQYLKKLDQLDPSLDHKKSDPAPPPATSPRNPTPQQTSRLGGLLRLILDWLSSLPSGCGLFMIFLLLLVGIFLYFRLNTSFFGLVGTDFNDLAISDSYQRISSDEIYWEVQFEGTGKSKYIGTVRYAAPIRIKEFPILTQDILVTTGDFANPDIVKTNVVDHKFFWKSPNTSSPSGTINLIHAVPANQEIYQILLEFQKGDTVKIIGREIFNIKAYQSDGTFLGTWQDMGCNSLLIESASLLKPEPEK